VLRRITGLSTRYVGDIMLTSSDSRERVERAGHFNSALDLFLRAILTVAALAIVAAAVFVMINMSEPWRNNGGRYLVAVGAFVLLIGVDTQFARLAWRKFELGMTEASGYKRYTHRATLLLVFAGIFLFGLALLLA
jgi:hypothetical protein